MNRTNGYQRAQAALLELKSVVLETLAAAGDQGLTNAALGRSLGTVQSLKRFKRAGSRS